jgi:hypothetical protein
MGLPDAPKILSETLDELTRPLRNRGMAWINDALKEIKVPENPASGPGTKPEKPWKPNFM